MASRKDGLKHAVAIVRAIAAGEWTNELPDWSPLEYVEGGNDLLRAVQTAEGFIIFFQAFDPTFDTQRFLVACGLVKDTPSILDRFRLQRKAR